MNAGFPSRDAGSEVRVATRTNEVTMAMRAPKLDDVPAKPVSKMPNAGQRSAVTRDDLLLQFVLRAPQAAEPMTEDERTALEQFRKLKSTQRA